MRIVRNVAKMNRLYSRIHRRKDWISDPELAVMNPEISAWMHDLPADLNVNYPPDGSAPWLTSAFIGNMHSYYNLSIILLHRPQLNALDPSGMDGQWKHHMRLCYNATKDLCRLQESILANFNVNGLQCMQRGVNFSLYCILTCMVLHLVRRSFTWPFSFLFLTTSRLPSRRPTRNSTQTPASTSPDT